MARKNAKLATLPTREIRWVKYEDFDGMVYYATSSADKTKYYLYKEAGGYFECIAQDSSPASFGDVIRSQPH